LQVARQSRNLLALRDGPQVEYRRHPILALDLS
jgi:hypothetical protein